MLYHSKLFQLFFKINLYNSFLCFKFEKHLKLKIMETLKLNWVNIQDALPEKNVLVLVWRKKYNEPTSIYLAKRNSKELSINEDASKDCHWSGSPLNEVKLPSDDNGGIYFDRTFSDVTVIKWSYLF